MQLGDRIALQACLSVSPSRVLTRYRNLMIRKMDMQSCACPAVMEQTHCQLSTRHQRNPTWCFPGFFSIPFHSTLFLPLKFQPWGCLCCSWFIRGSSAFLQLGTVRSWRRKNERKRRSSDVPRGHTDDSEARLDLLQPPEAAHEFWGQSRRSGTSPLPAGLVSLGTALLPDGLIAVDSSKALEVAASDLSPLQICLLWCCQRNLGGF